MYKLTSEEKSEIYKIALESVIETKKSSKRTSMNDLRRIREEAKNGKSFEVTKESMQIALMKFFEDLYDSEIELKELIDNALKTSK